MDYKSSILDTLLYGAAGFVGVLGLLALNLAFPPLMFITGPLGLWYLYRTLSSDMRKIRGETSPRRENPNEESALAKLKEREIEALYRRKQLELQREAGAIAEMERKAREHKESIEAHRIAKLKTSASDFIEQCESPPEVLLLEELITVASLKPIEGALVGDGISLKTQQNVGRYRVDFLANDKLVIEVDGKQFHDNESTFYSDRERDQWLQLNGYRVIRLTAKQIFDSPSSAASMVLKLLHSHVGN